MILSSAEVVPYLIARNLVSARSVVEGDLTIAEASRRNRALAVRRKHGRSYLLKQGTGANGHGTLLNESKAYRLVHSRNAPSQLRRYLPGYGGYDPDEHVLVVEFVVDAHDLHEYHATKRRFPSIVAASLGDALGLLHRLAIGRRADEELPLVDPPWPLSLHRPDLETVIDSSGAQVEVIKILQHYPEFGRRLDDLRGEWTADAIVHLDVKFENCLVSPDAASPRHERVTLVDWEFAGIGDAAWDVGSVFSAYLSFWLLFVPVSGDALPEHFLSLARFPIAKMHPALRAFWRSYVRRTALLSTPARELLRRSVRYAAARLVQTSFEQMDASPQLIGTVVCSLQLALNMLTRPQEAAEHLLGISD